jgi:hypothetical protein
VRQTSVSISNLGVLWSRPTKRRRAPSLETDSGQALFGATNADPSWALRRSDFTLQIVDLTTAFFRSLRHLDPTSIVLRTGILSLKDRRRTENAKAACGVTSRIFSYEKLHHTDVSTCSRQYGGRSAKFFSKNSLHDFRKSRKLISWASASTRPSDGTEPVNDSFAKGTSPFL